MEIDVFVDVIERQPDLDLSAVYAEDVHFAERTLLPFSGFVADEVVDRAAIGTGKDVGFERGI